MLEFILTSQFSYQNFQKGALGIDTAFPSGAKVLLFRIVHSIAGWEVLFRAWLSDSFLASERGPCCTLAQGKEQRSNPCASITDLMRRRKASRIVI